MEEPGLPIKRIDMHSFEHPMNQTESHEESARQAEWEASQEAAEAIAEHGFQAFLETLDQGQLNASCYEGEHTVCCIDERVSGCLHAAGSLILMSEEEARDAVERSGATALSSHRSCGAMAIHFRKVKGLADDAVLDQNEVDRFGVEETQALAERLGLEYAGESEQSDLEFHNARGVLIHTTPFFNGRAVDGMLPAFAVSAAMLSDEQSVYNAVLAAAIAQGDHGFGKRFTAENPFLILTLEPEESSASLVSVVEKVSAQAGLPVQVHHGTVAALSASAA